MVQHGITRKNTGYTCGVSSFVGLNDFLFRSLRRLAITSEAYLVRPSTIGGAAQKLDGIILPGLINRFFCRGMKGAWL